MSNLNERQFFHGTTHVIKDGMVRPGNDADKNVSEYSMGDPGDMSEGDHAFVSEHENYAWRAAETFHPSLRRARVYETGPAQDMKPGPWNKEHPDFLEHNEVGEAHEYPSHEAYKEVVADTEATHHQPEWASPTGFPVKNRIDIKPGHQGTFPDIAWGRYSEQPYSQEINHPTDLQVKYGTRAGRENTEVDAAARIHEKALKENEAVDEFRQPPRRRTGAALRAFMRGEPEPPKPRVATLFD